MDFIHLVLSLLAVVPPRLKYNPHYQCSMSREIHHLQLKFASFLCLFLTVDERLENATVNRENFMETFIKLH